MKERKHQWIAVILAVVFLLGFYFVFDIKSKEFKLAEKSRAQNIEVTSIANIKKTAFDSLSTSQKSYYDALQIGMHDAVDEEEKIKKMKELSGFWYRAGNYALAGDLAKQIAEIENTDQAWAIAGTTFATGISNTRDPKIKQFNQSQAIKAFENAISLAPDKPEYQTNLAISYAELPPKNNPMKGILMLLDISKKYPEDPGVLVQLGRLGIQTGQYDKAIGRLQKALELEPNYKKASCYLAKAYAEVGDLEKSEIHRAKCEQ